jgi:hypothetical protein
MDATMIVAWLRSMMEGNGMTEACHLKEQTPES